MKLHFTSVFALVACTAGMLLSAPAMAQDGPHPDTFGFKVQNAHNLDLTQADDGSWTYVTLGDDPYCSTTGLTRELTATENTLTLEYKANQPFQLEIFFSKPGGGFNAERSVLLGTAPAADEWTRVDIDITSYRQQWDWGHVDQNVRLDAGVAGGLTLMLRDFRVCETTGIVPGFDVEDGAVQIRTQDDFDRWVAGQNAFVIGETLKKLDVDLLCDVTARSTTGCIVENLYGTLDGHGHTLTLDMVVDTDAAGIAPIRNLRGRIQNLHIDGVVEGDVMQMATVAVYLVNGSSIENVHSSATIISHTVGDGTHGGIAAYLQTPNGVRNIVFNGKIANPEGVTDCCGGLFGWCSGGNTYTLEGALMIGDISEVLDNGSNTIGRNQGLLRCQNVFAGAAKNETPDGVTIVTPEQLASGEVCYALNGSTYLSPHWYQTIGEDPIPMLDDSRGIVYPTNEGYASMRPEDEASFAEFKKNFQWFDVEDGAVQIRTQEDFDNWVAGQNAPIIGETLKKLDVDLLCDVTARSTTGCIVENLYGTLDGHGHTLTLDMVVDTDAAGIAPIRNLRGRVENLRINGVVEGDVMQMATVAVNLVSGSSIENVHSSATIVSHTEGDGTHGGIAAYLQTSNGVRNVVFDGKIANPDGVTDRCGGLFGWCSGGNTYTIENVLMIANISEVLDNGSNTIGRNQGCLRCNNVFAGTAKNETPDGVTIATPEQLASGEVCFALNGGSFLSPRWYQTIGDDPAPTLYDSRDIVYPTVGGYASVRPEDEVSLTEFKKSFPEVVEAYAESDDVTTYGGAAETEAYLGVTALYAQAQTMEEFQAAYNQEQALRQTLEASIKAYKDFEAFIIEMQATLESRDDFGGADRDFLEDEYIDGTLEPGDDDRAPNGGALYILDNRLLTPGQLTEETALVRELLRIAVQNGYGAGSDITSFLANADFANGFDGWQGVKLTGYGRDSREGGTIASAEGWGAKELDMYQEVVAGKTGIYELQMHGAYRPFNDAAALQYYPYIYINDYANYLQCGREDYMPVADAIDQVNHNLTGAYPDLLIHNEAGDSLGWVIQGVHGSNIAYSAGRYDNRILAWAQAGDTLRIGVRQPYSRCGANEWVGVGDIHLVYAGDMEQAAEAVDRVLASQLARAASLQSIEIRSDEDYLKYPGYSQTLKDRLAEAIQAAEAATDARGKCAAIAELSRVFKEVVACKHAYQSFFSQLEDAYSYAFKAAEVDPAYGAIAARAQAMYDQAIQAYVDGTLSMEEALACEVVREFDVFATQDEAGTYHIANTAQYCHFTDLANAKTTDANGYVMNAVLDGDVCMNTSMMINNFYGTFDGRGHTMHVDITAQSANTAPFRFLRGATVKNLVLRGTISTGYKDTGTLGSQADEAGGRGVTIEGIRSYVEIASSIEGDGTHGGILARTNTGKDLINNCLFAGSFSGSSTNSCGGIVGWKGGNSNTTISNCLVVASATIDPTGCDIIARPGVDAVNCYYLQPLGGTSRGTTQVTEEQLLSGEVAYLLNGGLVRSTSAWRQTLGEDIMPTLDKSHAIVYRRSDGSFSNEPENELERHDGTEEDPFPIATAGDLVFLRNMLTPGRTNHVRLVADIDMTGVDNWVPLNLGGDMAGGRGYQNIIDFDGQGHVIRNFTCRAYGEYESFFGILNGNVRNCGWENAIVDCPQNGTGILCAYMGHNEYTDESLTEIPCTMTNVWVTGKLTTADYYTGGVIGNIGGPGTLKNVYAHVDIVSSGTTNNVGGIVGRVRDRLVMDRCYAAGTIQCASPFVGGIVGGGTEPGTFPASYSNIVVWNNEDANFGPLKEAMDTTMPEADLFDLAIGEDGSIADRSAMGHKIETVGETEVKWNDRYQTYAYMSKAEENGTPKSYLKIDYSKNDAFKAAMASGYTMEVTFATRNNAMNGYQKPFGGNYNGGVGIELNNGTFQHAIYAEGGWCVATSVKAVPQQYYHAVAVFSTGNADPADNKVHIYVNGRHTGSANAQTALLYPVETFNQWIGVGANPNNQAGGADAAGNFEIISARIYSQAMTSHQVSELYCQQECGHSYLLGDRQTAVSYFDGTNHAALQQTVVDWGKPWTCTMLPDAYPTFDGSTTAILGAKAAKAAKSIHTINGIRVEKAVNGLYIIDGRKVMVK